MVVAILNRSTTVPGVHLSSFFTQPIPQDWWEVATTLPHIPTPTAEELAAENAAWNDVFERKAGVLATLAAEAMEDIRRGDVTSIPPRRR